MEYGQPGHLRELAEVRNRLDLTIERITSDE